MRRLFRRRFSVGGHRSAEVGFGKCRNQAFVIVRVSLFDRYGDVLAWEINVDVLYTR